MLYTQEYTVLLITQNVQTFIRSEHETAAIMNNINENHTLMNYRLYFKINQ